MHSRTIFNRLSIMTLCVMLLSVGSVTGDITVHETGIPCGTVTLLEGESDLTMPAMTQYPLVLGDTLYAGAVLRTGSASRVEVVLADRGTVRLSGDTSIELAAHRSDAETVSEQFQVALLEGEMWVNLPKQAENHKTLQVLVGHTLLMGPESVFRAVLFSDGAAEIKTYKGQVTASGPFEIQKDNNRFGLNVLMDDEAGYVEPWRYKIEPYRKILVQASGNGTRPFRYAARADITEWVLWNQERDEMVE